MTWGVWGGATDSEPAHWLNAHTGTTIVFLRKEKAEEVARAASLNGLKYEAKLFTSAEGGRIA